ncbi:MAG: response regulator transcription factor, partial [Chloroflexi bacterium]
MPPAKKILIVDDEAMIRKAVHLALEKEGYEVVEAETGGEA